MVTVTEIDTEEENKGNIARFITTTEEEENKGNIAGFITTTGEESEKNSSVYLTTSKNPETPKIKEIAKDDKIFEDKANFLNKLREDMKSVTSDKDSVKIFEKETTKFFKSSEKGFENTIIIEVAREDLIKLAYVLEKNNPGSAIKIPEEMMEEYQKYKKEQVKKETAKETEIKRKEEKASDSDSKKTSKVNEKGSSKLETKQSKSSWIKKVKNFNLKKNKNKKHSSNIKI